MLKRATKRPKQRGKETNGDEWSDTPFRSNNKGITRPINDLSNPLREDMAHLEGKACGRKDTISFILVDLDTKLGEDLTAY